MTVLFADLVDSTAHAERLDPEDLRGVLSPYFARVREEIDRFGGTVEKFIGDAVMAVFGAPMAHEDDPERAVRAALALRDAVAELNERTGRADLHVRVAVSTGEAMVSLAAAPGTGEGMIAGDVANTAFRLQTAAPIDGILVGEATYRVTAGVFDYRDAGAVDAKGKSEPVPAWEPVALREGGSAERRTPLVGRRHELDTLLDALRRVRTERAPQLVSLVGVPGIGKTRLVRELVDAIEEEPGEVSWRAGRCLPYGEGVSFAALAEMTKAEVGVRRADAAEVAESKLRETLSRLFRDSVEARWIESHLRPLVGLEAPVGSGDRRDESFTAWRRFFEAVTERRPLVLVFEDLHWADDAVLDFVDHLVDWATAVPLLVLCTARPELLERRPGWGGGKRNFMTLTLAPLSDAEMKELIGAVVGDERVPDQVLANAGGNPLYGEQYAQMLAERDRFAAGALTVPDTVQAIIAARLDTLPPPEKNVLQAAAVFGKSVSVGAAAAVADCPPVAAEERLHALERKEFLRRERQSSVLGEVEYAFRHVLVREVAYRQVPRPRRAAGHRAAAEWIESLAADRDDQIELLAHHYLSALELSRECDLDTREIELPARAALWQAGDRASALNAFHAASRFYEEALELWPDDDPEHTQVEFAHAKALFHEGAGGAALERARDELLGVGDTASAAEAEALLGVLANREGRAEAAVDHARRAGALLQDAPSSAPKAHATAMLAGVLMTDTPRESMSLALQALAMADDLGLDELRAHALTTAGFARFTAGDLGGIADLEAAVATMPKTTSTTAVRAYSNLAVVVAHQGDLRRSTELRAAAAREAERLGNAWVIWFLESERAGEMYWSGRWDEALQVADDLFERTAAGERHYGEILCRQISAEIRLARGDLDGALVDVEKSLDASRATGHPQSLYPALAIGARVLLAAGRVDDARRLVDELLERWAASATPASFWAADLAVVLATLGRAEDLKRTASPPTRWLDAAAAYGDDPLGAASVYAEIATRPDEATARARAAAVLAERGDRAAADAELDRALQFFRDVGAEAFANEAEAAFAAAC